MSGQHIWCGLHYQNLESSVWSEEVICRDNTFSVVAAMKIMGLYVQCILRYHHLEYSVWNMELTSFYLGWVSGVIFTVRYAIENQILTMWCIRIWLDIIHRVCSNYRTYPEYVCVLNHIWLFCNNGRKQNYDKESIGNGQLWIDQG